VGVRDVKACALASACLAMRIILEILFSPVAEQLGWLDHEERNFKRVIDSGL
jgi:hypothetical protein